MAIEKYGPFKRSVAEPISTAKDCSRNRTDHQRRHKRPADLGHHDAGAVGADAEKDGVAKVNVAGKTTGQIPIAGQRHQHEHLCERKEQRIGDQLTVGKDRAKSGQQKERSASIRGISENVDQIR